MTDAIRKSDTPTPVTQYAYARHTGRSRLSTV